jgi:hypothetical protein
MSFEVHKTWYKFAKIIVANKEETLRKRGVSNEVIKFILSLDKDMQKRISGIAFLNPSISLDEIKKTVEEKTVKGYEQQKAALLLGRNYSPEFKKWLRIRTRFLFSSGKDIDIQTFRNNISDIYDWYLAKKEENPKFQMMSLSFKEAQEKSNIWHEAFSVDDGSIYQTEHPCPILYRFEKDDCPGIDCQGWTVRLLEKENDFSCEGNKMGNCVGKGAYFSKYENGKIMILSLRDPNNEPHVTVEIEPPTTIFDRLNNINIVNNQIEEPINAAVKAISSFYNALEDQRDEINGEYTSIPFDYMDPDSMSVFYTFLTNCKAETGIRKIDQRLEENLIEEEEYESDDYYEEEGLYNVYQIRGAENKSPIKQYETMMNVFFNDSEAYEKLHQYCITPINIPKPELIKNILTQPSTNEILVVEDDFLNNLDLIEIIPKEMYALAKKFNKEELFLQYISDKPKIIRYMYMYGPEKIKPTLKELMKNDVEYYLYLTLQNQLNSYDRNPQINSEAFPIIFNQPNEQYKLIYMYFVSGVQYDERTQKFYSNGKFGIDKKHIIENPSLAYAASIFLDDTDFALSASINPEKAYDCLNNSRIFKDDMCDTDEEFTEAYRLIRAKAIEDPILAFSVAREIDKCSSDDTRKSASQSPETAMRYAFFENKYTKETFDGVLKDKNLTLEYLINIPEMEEHLPDDFTKIFEGPYAALKIAIRFKKILSQDIIDDLRKICCKDPEKAYKFALSVDEAPMDITRYGASLCPEFALKYAAEIDKAPHPVTRWGVSKNCIDAREYALLFDGDKIHPVFKEYAEQIEGYKKWYKERFPQKNSETDQDQEIFEEPHDQLEMDFDEDIPYECPEYYNKKITKKKMNYYPYRETEEMTYHMAKRKN